MTTVKIERRAWLKMQGYTRAAKGEVSGLATVEEIDGSLVITDTLFCKQEATGGHVLLSPEDLSEKITELAADDEGIRVIEQLKCWWHSHVNMGTFRSQTDKDTATRLLQTMPYMLCLVVNKRQEYELTLYARNPLSEYVEDAPAVEISATLLILDDEAYDIEQECAEEVANQVTDGDLPAIQSMSGEGYEQYPLSLVHEEDRTPEKTEKSDKTADDPLKPKASSQWIWIPEEPGSLKHVYVKRGSKKHWEYLKDRGRAVDCTDLEWTEYMYWMERRSACTMAGLTEEEVQELCEGD